ncbi:MAG: sigma-70 family RNA polymerase sigma factor [Anaerolineales bacterium]|jgi:RNA polymerase sigma-70 factor (ECF subfamily)|nr:sigma-70 family RNA polymerase sigma factor [Anaerolineales bacterium]
MGNEDRELIERLQQGSLDSLGILYDRYQRLVFRTALAITGDPDAAADLQQEVFLRLFRFAERIDPNRPLEPWLYRMTANLSYTWVKRSSRWIRPLEDLAEWLAGSRRSTPVQQIELDETSRQIQQAMLSLPLPHRLVVALYYVNDLPLQEIAEILEIPVGTVKSRLFYGRQALRQDLEKLRADLYPGEARPELEPLYEYT